MEAGRPDLYHEPIFTSKEVDLIKVIKDKESLHTAILYIEDLGQKLYEERIYKLLQLQTPYSREENNFKWANERIKGRLDSLTGEHTDKAIYLEIAAYAISCYRGMYKRDAFKAANLDYSYPGDK